MNGNEVLRIVDAIHRDKNIDKEIVFEGIQQAILSAARKHFGEEENVIVEIDRETGQPSVSCNGEPLNPDEIADLGRIAAQTAKQVIIQKIREAERDAWYEEFDAMRGQIVSGTVTRMEGGAAIVNLGKVEGVLPRGEQIPGESHRAGERVRAIVLDVKKQSSRVKIILSRTHPEFVRRLFELEIPEVAEHIIEVRSLAREAGYRSKVAVSCFDSKIDCVGACVGVRGSRIKCIVDELAGERIDIVRWNDSLQVLVPNALQPAEVEDVILCPMLGKVIVLVREDQLSLAIGKKGQNVRLASKLVGWDIHVLTQERLDEQLDKSVTAFSAIPNVSEELAENLVAQGFFTFDDLSVIEPDQLAELGGLTPEECDAIIAYADAESIRVEREERQAAQEAAAQRLQDEARARAEAEAGVAADLGSDEETGTEEASAEAEEPAAEAEETGAAAVATAAETEGGSAPEGTAEDVTVVEAESAASADEGEPEEMARTEGSAGEEPDHMTNGSKEESEAKAEASAREE